MKTVKIKFHILALFLIFLTGCGVSAYNAAEKGDIAAMKSIIREGADLNKGNITGSTPLHIAAQYGKTEMVKLLIGNFADISKRNSFLKTPLHVAAEYGHSEIVRILMDHGAKIGVKDNLGNTPLLSAAENGHLETVKLLLNKGANSKYRNSFSESAVHLARKKGHNEVAAFIGSFSHKEVTADRKPPVIEIYSPLSRGLKVKSDNDKILISGKVTDESGVKSLLLNGRNISFTKEGFFKEEVTASTSDMFELKAFDTNGNYSFQNIQIEKDKRREISIKSEGKYFALIIGNNDYINLPKLKTAVDDAVEIESVLKELYGFKTRLLLNSSKLSISRALNSLRKEISKEDHLLIYYAGHGIYDEKVNKAYWLPVDAEKDDDTNWIIADTITTSIRRFSAKHVLVISDSCYSGTLTRNASVSMGSKEDKDEYISKMLDRPSRTLLASGGNEPVADGLGGKHSVFASSLIEGLKRSAKIFTAENLFYQSIKESVAGKSSQVPQYTIIRDSGHGGGDFVFRKKEQK